MPTEPGVKLDTGKMRLDMLLMQYFPRALTAVCGVSEFGAEKYCPFGWESVEDGYQRYSDALIRHHLQECAGEEYDQETGLLHAAHRAWNALATLELKLRELEK